MSLPRSTSVALIACRVLEAEIAELRRHAPHIVRAEFFDIGLHDQPAVLRQNLMKAIERAESDWAADTIVLAYGLCGLALVDLRPLRKPLVMPRAHDCVTLFLGSKERYAACAHAAPGTYWYSPGWNRAGRVAGPEREATLRREYTERFGAEDAEALLEMERSTFASYTTAAYTDLGLPGDDEHRKYAKRCASAIGWQFEHHPGDPKLLHDLLHGPWDDARFLVVRAGQHIAHCPDANIVKAVPLQ